MLIPKVKKIRSAKHLDFVRQLPCVICGTKQNIQACHIRSQTGGGTGMKPSDEWTVPMCHRCHAEQHRIGERAFFGDIGKIKALARFIWVNTGNREECMPEVIRYR